VVELGISLKIDQWKALKEQHEVQNEDNDTIENASPIVLGIKEVKLYLENMKDTSAGKRFTDYITEVRNWCMLFKNKKRR
jgi:hypothetical protein